MNRLTYKTKERYAFGWTDPRMPQCNEPNTLIAGRLYRTDLEEIATETLRNLWLVRFGEHAVTLRDMYALRDDVSIMSVVKELANRGLVDQETLHRVDTDMKTPYYVLSRIRGKNGNY